MASQHDKDDPIAYDSAAECETAVTLTETSVLETAQDVSVYSMLSSEIGVSMENVAIANMLDALSDCLTAGLDLAQPSGKRDSENTTDEEYTASTALYAQVTNPSESAASVQTAWVPSDPSVYTPQPSTCLVEYPADFVVSTSRKNSQESLVSTGADISVYEEIPSEVEVEPPLKYQMGPGTWVSDSLEEVAKRSNANPTAIIPQYTAFAWGNVKTDSSEYSSPPSEIEVEFDAWRIWNEHYNLEPINATQ